GAFAVLGIRSLLVSAADDCPAHDGVYPLSLHDALPISVRHNDDPVGFVAQCQLNQGNCSETPQATDFYLVTSPDNGVHWTLPFQDRKSTRLNSSHQIISYAVFCLKKKNV